MSAAFDVYARLPWWLQNVACSGAGLVMRRRRYGPGFHAAFERARAAEHLSSDALRSLQLERLERTCTVAADTVPWYAETFRRVGFNPRRFSLDAFLERVPVLTKADVRRLGARLHSTSLRKLKPSTAKTSGTTGTSLHFLQTAEHVDAQWATWWRHRARFGLKVHDAYANFGGRDVVPTNDLGLPAWRINLPMRQTYFSLFHLTDANMQGVVDYLDAHAYDYVSGFPSALVVVASWMNARGRTLRRPPRAVATGAETLLDLQRRQIAQAFGTVVTDQYGLTEGCVNISECEHGRYHVDADFAFAEFLPLDDPKGPRRIVGTTFFNDAMPLIRYDTGDVATPVDEACPCGRALPVVGKIDGRIEAVIRTPDGRNVGRLDYIFKDAKTVVEAQIVQTAIDQVVLRLVRAPGYSQADEAVVRQMTQKYLGETVALRFEYVEAIPREPNGKFRGVISQL